MEVWQNLTAKEGLKKVCNLSMQFTGKISSFIIQGKMVVFKTTLLLLKNGECDSAARILEFLGICDKVRKNFFAINHVAHK